ncbi:CBS domain-containing protein [Rhizobium leguminosarum]|uniref:CBS domain-containing protein n=1 Tax=Rhizobium leguminosarum TaxID=384 RepID=UPI001DE48D09|nr:CBS domain-containing protein [Rhizobium leguminosarum]MBP2445084.1 CBS domain-containing protein [Rhizobium leguminosarum]
MEGIAMLAKDIMASPVTTIGEDQNVRHAIEIINATKFGAVPVVDAEGVLTGIVTEGDLLRRISSSNGRRPVPHTRDRKEALADYIKARSWRIKDVMTTPVISAVPTATITQLADLLLAHPIKHIPVVAEGRLVGMVSRRDLMRALVGTPSESTASGDQALQTAVCCRLESELGIAPKEVETSVSNGLVILRGEVESSIEREAARVAAESVPGVQGVSNNIQVAYRMLSRMKPRAE